MENSKMYLWGHMDGHKARVLVFLRALRIYTAFSHVLHDPVHGVANGREEEVVHLHPRQQLVNARLLKQIENVGMISPAYSRGHPWRTSDQRSSSLPDPVQSSSAPAFGQECSFSNC